MRSDLHAFPYRRFGGRAGVTYDVTALIADLGGPARRVRSTPTLPIAPTRELPDGRIIAVDLHLDPGDSRVMTASFGVRPRHAPRSDPAALGRSPRDRRGARLVAARRQLRVRDAVRPLRALLAAVRRQARDRLQVRRRRRDRRRAAVRSHPRRRRQPHAHATRARRSCCRGGAARHPRHARPTSRSTATSAAARTLEYAFELFRGTGKNRVYGGDLFFGVGLWGLGEQADLRARDAGLCDALPIDIYVDAGVRIDTDVGVFEVTIANALGRLR